MLDVLAQKKEVEAADGSPPGLPGQVEYLKGKQRTINSNGWETKKYNEKIANDTFAPP